MSDFGFQVSPRLNQTGRVQYSVEDVYHITRGSFKEFNLKGYNPPKTAIPLSKEYKIPIDKDRDLYKDIKKKSADPNSTTYAYSNEKILTKYWHKPMGKFHTYRRHTFTEDAIKRSLKLPGPGAYLSTPKGKIEKKNFALGKFDKDQISSFLCNTEALAEEVPAANCYLAKHEDRDKAYSKIENRAPAFKYHAMKKPGSVERAIVGPGYLKDLEDSFKKSSLRKKTPDAVFGKSKLSNTFQNFAQSKKFVPGVGAYKDSERAFKNHIVLKKERMPFISNSKLVRCTEKASKDKEWVPGPGSYNIIPYSKKEKKS